MKRIAFVYMMTCFAFVAEAAPITWIAVDPNNDMEDPANWSTNSVPGSGDQAIFISAAPNVALNPTDSTAPFSVSSFHFLFDAFPFTFHFNNQTLTFNGDGITGNLTDTLILIDNLDNSASVSNIVAFLASESTSGSAQIYITNSANVTAGSNATLGAIDSLFHATGDFKFGEGGRISLLNKGDDSANGTGNNRVANTAFSQMRLDGAAVMKENTAIFINNAGTFTGLNTTQSDQVANIANSQFLASGAFEAEGEFFLALDNSGTDSGKGVGGDQIGNIIGGQQAVFQNGLTLGDSCAMDIRNGGSSSATKASATSVGCITGNGNQLLVNGTFLAGDGLSLFMQNSGNESATGAGGNQIACINNGTNTGSQIHLNSGASIGNDASIFMLNTGTRTVTTASASGKVSGLDTQQFYSASDFHAGNGFNIQALNSGASFGSGQNNQFICNVGGSQVDFETSCTLGDNAVIFLLNSGLNADLTGTNNTISVISGSQLRARGDFTAGSNLQLLAFNTAGNSGDASNVVGLINDSQISFEQACNLNDGSLISANNSGTVTNCQIEFLQGFNVLSGKAFIQAFNSGTFGCFGIEILGNNAGGNAEVQLGNSSLSIDTTLPTFTLGGLSGDSTSFAESLPTLILNTDSSTLADFAGAIQDFPASTTDVIKTGPGTQILSGTNTYTGLTTVEGGTLVINGSIAEDLVVDTFGTLKGVGTIGGNVTNFGTIAPGQSIGTLNILGNYINNVGSIYAVEVNGAGASDLLNVTGQAKLNGGKVVVSTEDGFFQFRQPYTIVTASGGVVGVYEGATSAAFIKPILTYDPANVYLTIEPDLIRAADSCNQAGVATVLDSIISPNTPQYLLINAIANLSLDDAQKALGSLSGYQYTHDIWMTEISVRRFLRNLYNPLRSAGCNGLCTAWIETGDSFTHLQGKDAKKAHADSYQVTGGVQKEFTSNITFGLAGSYEYDRLSFQHGKSRRNTKYAAAYGLFSGYSYYGLFDLVYGHTSSKFKRGIQINEIRGTSHSKPKIDIFTFYGEAGIDYFTYCFLIQPFVGIQIGKNWRDRLEENGLSDFALAIHQHNWTTTSARLGFHLTTVYDGVDVSLDLAWNERLSSSTNKAKGRFKEFGDAFPICGNDLGQASVDYALTVAHCFCDNWKGYVEVAGESWSRANTFEVLGGLEYSW